MSDLPRSFNPVAALRHRQLHALVDAIPPGALASCDSFTFNVCPGCISVSYFWPPPPTAPASPIPPMDKLVMENPKFGAL